MVAIGDVLLAHTRARAIVGRWHEAHCRGGGGGGGAASQRHWCPRHVGFFALGGTTAILNSPPCHCACPPPFPIREGGDIGTEGLCLIGRSESLVLGAPVPHLALNYSVRVGFSGANHRSILGDFYAAVYYPREKRSEGRARPAPPHLSVTEQRFRGFLQGVAAPPPRGALTARVGAVKTRVCARKLPAAKGLGGASRAVA